MEGNTKHSVDMFPFIMTGIIIVMIGLLVAGLVVPYGDDVTVYGDAVITSHCSKNNEYYVIVIIPSTQCGTFFEQTAGLKRVDMKVSYDVFSSTYSSSRRNVAYDCVNGNIENFKWC